MSRRVSLPGADELFRTTGGTGLQSSSPRRKVNGEAPPRVPGPGDGPDAERQGKTADRPAAPGPAAAASGQETDAERRGSVDRTPGDRPVPGRAAERPEAPAAAAPAAPRRRGRAANRRPSGRERHDEKITVYVSAEELMDLEHARLVLRGEHGLAVDRGRIVREAVAVVLADLESRGDASILVRRLRGR
ncbi:hypothetical protein AB0K09_08370 [Streptomyces sp. NPDC049577]|uniref:hypothetical protein n=1 Tax=Streptomyces sp. NPDC049577 TaxID=3155153 RepID=UPI00342FE184